MIANVPVPLNDIIDTVLAADYRRHIQNAEALLKGMWNIKKELTSAGIIPRIRRSYLSQLRHSRQARLVERVNSFIKSIVSNLDVDQATKNAVARVASELIRISVKNGKSLYGKMPEALAAASIYIVARLLDVDITQKDVAKLAGVSETNIRKAFRFLLENQAIIAPLRVIKEAPEPPRSPPGPLFDP
jgi:transcription initiation factor TFIIIB Brf1 subunit/transcription initiation factor TFIIB